MVLTRQQRERLVLDLYNQGKNTREIAQEVRMSFSAIGAILKKATQENERSKEKTEKMSQSAKAYKFFSDGKSPVDVAIALNLRQAEVTELYKEYWNLKNLYELNQVYEEIKGDIISFVNLYKLAKTAGMNTQHVIRLLAIANNYLPSVEQRYEKLKGEEASLQVGNHNSARTFKKLSDEISYLHGILDSYRSSCEEERRQMGELYQKMIRQEALVNDFQDNNEEYLKIIKTVGEEVLGVISNVKVLLKYALLSMTESIRNDPKKFRSIFNNISSMIDYSSNGQDYMYGQQQQSPSPDYNTEANTAIIICEAEKLFYKLVKDSINKIIIDYPFSKSSLPSLPLSPASDEGKSYEIKSNDSS
jgi:hypothetical protein